MSNEGSASLKKLTLPPVSLERVNSFIERWKYTEGSGAELADFQSFLLEMCDVLELPKPDPKSDSTKDAAYIFERPVDSFTSEGARKKSKNRIDLYRRDCFVMEGKQSGKKIGSQGWNSAMQKAKNQADNYIRSLPTDEGRPPFIVVVDVGNGIQLYSEFSRSGGIYVPFPDPSHYLIKLEDLGITEIQKRLQTLWISPDALDSSKYAAKVTKEVSVKLAQLAKLLEASGFDVGRTAHFLKRCLFTMFCEDVDLIPEGSFTKLLQNLKETPEHFSDSMRTLWNTMNAGGFEGQLRKVLPRFNGGLFQNIDPIPLNREQIQLLIEAAKADWRYVEPAIFGTLLERALDPRERHKLGAHYTPRAYVERLVMPTIIEPLRDEWETVKVSVEILLQQGSDKKAIEALRAFHFHLCEIKVLDPACGSANFLYVALEHLKRLEGEVLNAIRDLSAGQITFDAKGLMVDPHQFLGIEINPRAAAIAEIVLWIGYLQWHYRIHGRLNIPEPILRDFNNIENRDALMEYDDRKPLLDDEGKPVTIWNRISFKTSAATGQLIPDETQRIPVYHYINPHKAKWPQADYIVGNPPFIGASTMRRALGDGYVEAVRETYDKDVPESADFVMHWWHIAAEKVRDKKDPTQRFGFITTNSMRQTFNRRVVEPHLNDEKHPLSLAFAIPDHPWVDSNDGAAVRIAMTVGTNSLNDGKLQQVIEEDSAGEDARKVVLRSHTGKIFADLNIGPNLTSTNPLKSNGGLSNRGVSLFGSGFIVDKSDAINLGLGRICGLENHIRNYRNGRDILQISRDVMVIDLYGLSDTETRNKFPDVYQWVLERVKPDRDTNKRESRKKNWWLFGETNPKLRKQLLGLSRYIITVETSKHRIFTFLEPNILPDNKLINIAIDKSVYFGILSSRLHVLWSMRAGSRLGVGNDLVYVKTKCFETFPFPEFNSEQTDRIRNLGEQIDFLRKQQQSKYPKLTLTNIYNVIEKLRLNEPLTKKEQEINQQGLAATLKELHDNLDKAVFEAYGWNDLAKTLVGLPGATTPLLDKPEAQAQAEEEVLFRLVELNHRRAAEEVVGKIRWLRPDYQSLSAHQSEIDLSEESELSVFANVDKDTKIDWPKEMRDQINMLIDLLSTPATADALALHFKRNPIKHVNGVLEALEALGKAQNEDGLWSLM